MRHARASQHEFENSREFSSNYLIIFALAHTMGKRGKADKASKTNRTSNENKKLNRRTVWKIWTSALPHIGVPVSRWHLTGAQPGQYHARVENKFTIAAKGLGLKFNLFEQMKTCKYDFMCFCHDHLICTHCSITITHISNISMVSMITFATDIS